MFLAQAGQGGPQGLQSILPTIIFAAAIFAVLYFLILRPQKKRDQQRKEMLNKIEKGSKVMTIGGIYGEVVAVKEDYVLLLVDKERGTTLKFSRNAVNNVVTETSAAQE